MVEKPVCTTDTIWKVAPHAGTTAQVRREVFWPVTAQDSLIRQSSKHVNQRSKYIFSANSFKELTREGMDRTVRNFLAAKPAAEKPTILRPFEPSNSSK
jgi:hypothetical protein